MQEADRKVLWAGIFTLAILILELAWLLFIGPASGYPGYTAQCERECNIPLWMAADFWVAVFTAFLTVSTFALWWQTRTAAQETAANLKVVERAYISFEFSSTGSFSTGLTGFDVVLAVKNTGKTPGIAYEVYGEIADKFPAELVYANKVRVLPINITVGSDAKEPSPIGNIHANVRGDIIFGYVKYRDIFGESHTTGFAVKWRNDIKYFVAVADTPFSYWT